MLLSFCFHNSGKFNCFLNLTSGPNFGEYYTTNTSECDDKLNDLESAFNNSEISTWAKTCDFIFNSTGLVKTFKHSTGSFTISYQEITEITIEYKNRFNTYNLRIGNYSKSYECGLITLKEPLNSKLLPILRTTFRHC